MAKFGYQTMAHFLLIHGAGHGRWCWYKIIPRLEQTGHTTTAIDLPSLGQDCTRPSEVDLESMVARVADSFETITGNVIPVGHSFGGVILNAVAEEYPEAIDRLVYLAAYLLPSNVTLSEFQGRFDSFAKRGEDKRIVDEIAGTISIKDPAIKQYYYNECSDFDVSLARLLLRPTPIASTKEPIETTVENFGQIPKTYIKCAYDEAIPPFLQSEMLNEVHCEDIREIEADHSPFFSSPKALTEVLNEVSKL